MPSPYLLIFLIVLIFLMWFHLIYLIDRLEKKVNKLNKNINPRYNKPLIFPPPIATDEERKQYLSYIKEAPFGMHFQEWKYHQMRKEASDA